MLARGSGDKSELRREALTSSTGELVRKSAFLPRIVADCCLSEIELDERDARMEQGGEIAALPSDNESPRAPEEEFVRRDAYAAREVAIPDTGSTTASVDFRTVSPENL